MSTRNTKIFITLALFFAFFSVSWRVQAEDLVFPTVADLDVGSLIKTQDSSTVYYFAGDEHRYIFPDENTYFTWYDDFSNIEIISDEEMASIPVGGVVTYYPQFGNDGLSTRLLKLAYDNTVYVPIGYGMLIPIDDEEAAASLFGENWSDYVDILPDVFAVNYQFLTTSIDESDSFIEPYDYSLDEDLQTGSVVGVMMYSDPLRFAVSDESVDCGEDYCAYNIAEVKQGGSLKFVNYAEDGLTIRDENNLWTTGSMDLQDIRIVDIDLEPGTYYFYADEDDSMVGVLQVVE
ncbi:hypothetical protein D6827_04020 [Candidatus Parcubacteria bacterium]|nr:MAG: hypothetical protein D6827_04020 [Candidatus Parcubacteria bacterium]